MIEKIAGQSAYTYILKERDKQVRYTMSYREYFVHGRFYNVDKYIEDLLRQEMDKLRNTL